MYSNVIHLIKLQCNMDTLLMISGNNKTSEPHRLFLNFSDKIDLKNE